MDLSKKFLYINPATDGTYDAAATYPASALKAIYEHTATVVRVALLQTVAADCDIYSITITSGEARTFMKDLVHAINYGTESFLVVADNTGDISLSGAFDGGTNVAKDSEAS